MNIVFFAYREWALKVVDHFNNIESSDINVINVIKSVEEYKFLENLNSDEIDYVILIGWSHIIKQPMLGKFYFLGIHPSNLPEYAGGSPLQHQIIEGITTTQCSLFRITEEIDAGEVLHRSSLSLVGDSMREVFNNLTISSITLLSEFFEGNRTKIQINKDSNNTVYKRRTPDQSKIDFSLISQKNLVPFYNFVRALTEPYPNAYLEDERGNKLYFKSISFEFSKKDE
jgi:methionyl-tRNA formyltransferase